MDKNAGQIYKEIIEGLNKCMGNDNFFKGTKVLVDRRNENNVLTTELTPYFYDDTMNVQLFWIYNSKLKYTSLELKHKYKECTLCIYKGKTSLEIEDSQPIDTGFKELDNWLHWVREHNKDIDPKQSIYNIDMLIHMFEICCKDYYLSAEKYFNNKKIADQLYEDMKHKEFKLT